MIQVVTAYNTYTEWSNKTGIISEDITHIQTLLTSVNQADSMQGDSMFTRKSQTMDKNQLQRAIEEEVSRISGICVLALSTKDAAVVSMFADLIPSSGSKPDKPGPPTTTDTKE